MKKNRLYIIAVIIIIFNLSGSIFLQAQITDIDGNTYNAIVIGNQTWMRENLKVTRFRDGSAITNITANATWASTNSAAYCWYNNNASNKDIYGALYNWQTVAAGNLCPSGYHVPSNDEWSTLVTFLGGLDVAGGKLKEAGIIHWLTPNTGATNESGFTALPGGSRIITSNPLDPENGTFSSIGGGGTWWSSTLFTPHAYYWGMIYNDRIIGNYTANQRFGMSVRCLRDMRPYLTSVPITLITQTSAQSGGNISGDGGMPVTARGVCWSTSANPTTFNNHSTDGSGIGSFISNLTGLTPNTTYYVRAYATNSVGTNYGTEYTFSTLSCPVITTTISGTTTICQNSASPNITFTGANGTAPYTFTYNINGGSNLTISTTSGNSVNLSVPTNTAGTFIYNLTGVYDIVGSTCSQVKTGTAIVTVNPLPTADAGPALSAICQGGTTAALGGSVGGSATGGTWSTPAGGTFNPNATTLNATWTPPGTFSGTATLTLTTTGGSCGTASASKTQVVIPSPTSSAGPALSAICQGGTSSALGGIVGGSATGGTWSTPAGGTFSPSATTLNATWTPPSGFSGTATLTLTTSGGSCGTAISSKAVAVNPLPTATLERSISLCINAAPPNMTFIGASGTAPYTFIYTINGGSNQTVTTSGGNSVYISAPTGTAGTFTYTLAGVSDANGCSQSQSGSAVVTINPLPTAPTVGAITQPTCALATGSLVLSGLPSTGTWTLTRTPGNVTTTGTGTSITISALSADTYTYTVTNAEGCTSASSPAIVINAQPATPAAPTVGTIHQPTCTNATGGVALSGLPASGNWTINPGSIVGSGVSTTIINLIAGTYSYTVTNMAGCTSASSANVVIAPQPLTPTAPGTSVIQPTCATATGTITVTVQNTGETYSFDNNSSFQTSNTKSGLAAGNYNIIIKSTGGCNSVAAPTTVNAQPPTPIVPNQAASISSGGTFTVTPNGVPVGTTYSWLAPTYTGGVTGGSAQTTQTNISGSLTIPSGTGTATYTVTPISGSCVGLTFTVTVTVISTCTPVTIVTQPAYNSMCATSGNASFTVVTSGTAPFTYQWQYNNGGTWETISNGTPTGASYTNATTATLSVTGITTGGIPQYRCYITNCSGGNNATSATANLTVNATPTPPVVFTITQPTCALATGSVVLSGLPASGTWTLTRTPGGTTTTGTGTSTTISALSADTYTYTVTNADGCTSASSPAIVINPPPVTPSVPTITASGPTTFCTGGSVTLTSSAGTTYLWSNAATTQSINVTTAGSYTVQVTNASGCQSAASAATVVTLNDLPVPTLTSSDADNIICSGSSVTFTAGGGTNYNFRVAGISVQIGASSTYTTSTLTNGQAVDVIVTNGTGCTATSSPITNIVNSLPTIFVSTPATCSDDLATYSLAVTVSTGTVTSTSGIVTNSGSNVWTVTEVTAGTNITLKVTDIAGCENTIVITSPNCSCPVVLAPVSGGSKSYCASAVIPSINATVLTGETVDWYSASSGGTLLLSGSTSYTPEAPGTYYAAARNTTTSCVSSTRTPITVTMNPLPTATASNNGPITPGSLLSLTGGPNGMTTYAWSGPNSFSSNLQNPTVSASATAEMTGVYTLTVTNTNGCVGIATTTVTFNPFIVTNVNDNGTGSLRYAMENANATVGVKEIITFDIPGYGPFVIQPQTAMPAITDPVIIDGYSQPGASAKDLILLIEIVGSDAGAGSNGLTISGGGCIVKGLIVNRFSGAGIQIIGSGTNSILGNFIGVDFSGTVPKGNSGDGIQIDGSANNKIGGSSAGEGNVISGNIGAGISILNTGAFGNLITSNSIYSNGGIGIDLGGNGVTNNDTGDPDNGPNYLQNFPVLGSANFSTGSVTISGSLNSAGSNVYNLQFFASKLADNSGNGEGQTYIGSKSVTTNGSGNILFTQAFSIKSSWGTVITATATDNLGNTSEFSKTIGGFQDQTVGQWPLIYTLNKDGVPNITDGTDLDAVRASFQTWSAIPTANIQFNEAGATTSDKYANASDGVNLVSFEDDQFPFSYGVLAVAAKTLKIDEGTQKATIIDADIVVNPDFVNDIKYNLGVGYNNRNAGYFDIQSVITHEIGHVIGLLHTGVVGSTMFFTLNSGTKVRTLEQDDKSWASYGYPSATYNNTYGSISGNVTYGYDGKPVAGALVYAISTGRQDSVHGYSDASGNYFIPGLIPGSYNVYMEPLDGNVNGYNLRPANISSYIYSNTVYTDYPGEFYNNPDLANEQDDSKSAVTVNAGSATSGINLITNKDNIHPAVVSVSPTDVSANLINISSNFSIKFSEAIDETSLTATSCYLLSADNTTIGGSYTTLGNNVVLFDPGSILEYNTVYSLHITQGVKDMRNNTLQPELTQSFTTISPDSDPPEINEVIPANTATNVFVTDKIRVFFSEPMNKASVENGFTLSWTDSGGPKTVEGSFSWANDNTSFTYTPAGSLRENTGYIIRLLNSITDLSGIHMVNIESRTFTTVAQAQVTILYLGPGNGNTAVPVTTPVVVDFSEPINPFTVNSVTFKLLSGNTAVQGMFEFLNDNSRVVFRPEVNLNFNQIYTISLTAGIQDVSLPTSSALSASLTTFTTAARFTVPGILYLEPSSGVVGNVVTITGTGFDPDPVKNKITFNGISAPVTKASLTSLTTEVPMGALSGPVEVTVNGTVSENTMYFYIIPETLAPCDDIIDNKSTGSSSSHDADVTEAVSVNGVLDTYAYITNPEEGTVSVLNLTSNESISPIAVGNTPMKIDINPQGTKAYVTNFNSHTVSVISLVKGSTYNKVIATIPVGIEPYGVAVTPDGKRVYVANYYSGNLSVIDEDPNSGGFDHVVANVSTGSSSSDVAVTADAGMVLVTGAFGLKIVNSNPADKDYNSVIANVSTGSTPSDVTATADAGLAIVSTVDGHLLLINLHPENGDYSDAVIANVSTGSKGSDVEASADNMFVYVTDTEHDQILVYQIGPGGSGSSGGSGVSGLALIPHNTIPVPNAPTALAISADASRLYVIDTNAVTGQKEITTIAICCGPISPSKAIGDLIITIQTMINKGDIPKLRGYALIFTLNNALRDIYANRTRLAIADLNAFKLLMNAYIKNKQISTIQGNALIKSINAIIVQLNSTKSGQSETYLSDKVRSNPDLISESRLGVIYPNPFSQSVTINYEVVVNDYNSTDILIRVYDIGGRLVGTLVDKNMQSGSYSTKWNGTYENGKVAPYGVYFLIFRSGNIEHIKEIMLIR